MSERPGPGPSPRRLRFLLLAGLMLGFAGLDYLLLGSMDYGGSSEILTAFYTIMALLLMGFVIAALLMLACYANPRLGRTVARRAQYIKDAWLVPMRHFNLGGWHSEGASEYHRLASRRIQMRHQRRRYAREGKEEGKSDAP